MNKKKIHINRLQVKKYTYIYLKKIKPQLSELSQMYSGYNTINM